MVAPVYVTPPVEDGQRLLDALADGGLPITAAAWLQSPDSGRWELMIVTPEAVPGQLRAASGRARAILSAAQPALPFPTEWRLYHPDEPTGRDLVTARQTWALGEPIRAHGGRFGEVTAEGVYIYPTQYGKSTWQLFHDVVDLLYEPLTPDVTVRLADRSTRTGTPVSVTRKNGEMCLNLYDRATGQTVSLVAGEVVDIRRVPGTPKLPQPQTPPAVAVP